MSSTTTSSSIFQSIFDAALADYARQTGIDLATYPFVQSLQSCRDPGAILDLLQERENQFRAYRDGNRKLINSLKPLVQVLNTLSGLLASAASMVPFQPTNAILAGVDVLLAAAVGVSASYDALVDLFECIEHFLGRLRIYTEIPFSSSMFDIVTKIMVEVLSVLSLATKQIKEGRLKKFAKKLLGEAEIEAVLQRLDRLTLDEARITGSETLQVVHGLVTNIKLFMDNGRTSMDDIRQTLVTMQQLTSEINKMKREQLQKDMRTWLSPPDPSKIITQPVVLTMMEPQNGSPEAASSRNGKQADPSCGFMESRDRARVYFARASFKKSR
ncbi:hypothetical protein BJV74DRAFT_404579 [Russula compacta]|nr:hypothetical protein BJV74DRAFT_404579 [Russula compacta]